MEFEISRKLFETINKDLRRKHSFAYERVGFLFCRILKERIVFENYIGIADVNYIEDDTVGARINSKSIRQALQHALTFECGVYHVHIHEHFGRPEFSYTDENFLESIIPPLKGVSPQMPHGGLLLSNNNVNARTWLPNGNISSGAKICFFEGGSYE